MDKAPASHLPAIRDEGLSHGHVCCERASHFFEECRLCFERCSARDFLMRILGLIMGHDAWAWR